MPFPSIKSNVAKIKEMKNGANIFYSTIALVKVARGVVFGEIHCNIVL